MADDVLINKAAVIERCVARARAEFNDDPVGFAADHTRQDAAVLNILRACEAAIDMGQHLVRRERIGVPQSARDVFELLARAGWIDPGLGGILKNMVGYRNIAVHDYQQLLVAVTVAVLTRHLDDFLRFTGALLRNDARLGP